MPSPTRIKRQSDRFCSICFQIRSSLSIRLSLCVNRPTKSTIFSLGQTVGSSAGSRGIGNGCEFSGKSALVDLFARLAGVVDQLTLNLLVVLRAKGYEPIDAGQKRGVDSQVTSFKLVGEAIYGFAEEDEFEPSHEGRIRNLVTFSLPPVVDLPQGGAVQAENEPGVANRFAQSGEREALHALHDQHIDLFFDQGSLEKLYVFLPGFIERIGKYSGFECQPVLLAEQLLLQQGGVDQNTHAACMEEIGKVASDRFCPSAREGAVVKGDGSDLHDVCCCR